MTGGEAGKKGLVHRNLSLCLIDLKTGFIYWNSDDEAIVPYLALFAPVQFDRILEETADKVRDRLLESSSLTIDQACESFDVPLWVVKRSFAAVARKDGYKLDVINDTLTIYTV